MNGIKKFFKWTLILLLVLIICLYTFIQLTWNKKFEAELPAIKSSNDSTLIARGKHLVFGPAHCATCHVPMDKIYEVENGLEMPLMGGWTLDIPPGTFRAPNITPDPETGIGLLSDRQIARALRFSVGANNECVFDFMPFQELSDEDLTAVISFLRSQKPVKNKVERSELKFLGKAISAFGMITPVKPKKTPPKMVKIDSTLEYGQYLANSVANCVGCHTERDLKTGKLVGKPFAGGSLFPPHDGLSAGYGFVSPNITPDKNSGIISTWTETEFIKRFKSGRVYEKSPMPWGAFSRMSELELKALYRYLKTISPVDNKIEKIVFNPGEKMPEI